MHRRLVLMLISAGLLLGHDGSAAFAQDKPVPYPWIMYLAFIRWHESPETFALKRAPSYAGALEINDGVITLHVSEELARERMTRAFENIWVPEKKVMRTGRLRLNEAAPPGEWQRQHFVVLFMKSVPFLDSDFLPLLLLEMHDEGFHFFRITCGSQFNPAWRPTKIELNHSLYEINNNRILAHCDK